jgi:hypothetical protein
MYISFFALCCVPFIVNIWNYVPFAGRDRHFSRCQYIQISRAPLPASWPVDTDRFSLSKAYVSTHLRLIQR